MKPFTKRLALVMGLLFTALICCGIVYIDTIQNYWYVNDGFVKLIVSNQTAQAVMTVDTNTGFVGIYSNNITRSVSIHGKPIPTNATASGVSAANTGLVQLQGSDGQHSSAALAPTTTGGTAGGVTLRGGVGGSANNATTNATGLNGGAMTIAGGAGGVGQSSAGVATNLVTGGNGGGVTITTGTGGTPAAAATNTTGGSGGNFTLTAGAGASPSAGWSRQGGAGGSYNVNSGSGGSGTRTNAGGGGAWSMTSGSGGSVSTGPGDAGQGGSINFSVGGSGSAVGGGNPPAGANFEVISGSGSTGATNSNGGNVFLSGGAPGSGAVPGNVVLARTANGTSRGAGVQIGPLITGGTATITNALGATLALDFPLTAAGTFSDLPIAITGVTSNNLATALSVPWESAQLGGAFVCYNSNATVFVRFINNSLAAAIDPTPGDFTVVGFRIR